MCIRDRSTQSTWGYKQILPMIRNITVILILLAIPFVYAEEGPSNCTLICPVIGYYPDPISCTCIPCFPGCRRCVGPSADQCTETTGAPIYEFSTLENFMPTKEALKVDATVAAFEDRNVEGFLAQKMCKKRCPNGQYLTPPCNCVECPSWCAECSGPENEECYKPKPPAMCFVGCGKGFFQAYPCDCIKCADGCDSCRTATREGCLQWAHTQKTNLLPIQLAPISPYDRQKKRGQK
eukprot:TRINITY_DN2390_c0_g1_i2.p1 TRINITY_DN2390_c0_g1~~TRINITY_DN2390_c0_g1_i2.p1  ORF type:complete len:237 (+),score=24.19 TRINITY_DN2390_c0_g1_i2:66-776(+)